MNKPSITVKDYSQLLNKCQQGVTTADQANALIAECFNAIVDLIDRLPNERTEKQSSSRWLYLDAIATQMNDAGIDRVKLMTTIQETARAKVDAQNSRETLYEDYWRPVHNALYPEVKRLNTEQIQKVYEAMNNHCARVFGISSPWPDRHNAGL